MRLYSLFVLASTFASCAKSPLEAYIKKNGYSPFRIPRENWGTGSIVNYKQGTEEIVALNSDCLKLDSTSTNVVLSQYSYTAKRGMNIELSLAKVLDKNLDISAAYTDSRVKNVVISIQDPKESIIPTIRVKRRIVEFNNSNEKDCLEEIVKNKNIVLIRVLSVKSLDYTFLDDKNNKIAIDAALLDKMNVDASYQNEYQGKTTLKVDKQTFFGFRAASFQAGSGLVDTSVKEKELSTKEVRDLQQ